MTHYVLSALSYTYASQALRYLCVTYWSSFMSVNVGLNLGVLCHSQHMMLSQLRKVTQSGKGSYEPCVA